MVDTKAMTSGAIGLVVFLVALVFGAVILNRLSQVTGLGADAIAAANNGTILLRDIPADWGQIIVLGIIAISVLAPLLFALIAIARQGGQ